MIYMTHYYLAQYNVRVSIRLTRFQIGSNLFVCFSKFITLKFLKKLDDGKICEIYKVNVIIQPNLL